MQHSVAYLKRPNMNKEDNLIHAAIQEADSIFLQLLDDYPQCDDEDYRQETVLMGIMTNCIARLHILGWTERELISEVFDWCQQGRNWRDAPEKE
jgi:hypothetical protein